MIEARYDESFPFINGLAAVVKDSRFGLINMEGNAVLELQYDNISGYTEGIAVVKKDNKWGLVKIKVKGK